MGRQKQSKPTKELKFDSPLALNNWHAKQGFPGYTHIKKVIPIPDDIDRETLNYPSYHEFILYGLSFYPGYPHAMTEAEHAAAEKARKKSAPDSNRPENDGLRAI